MRLCRNNRNSSFIFSATVISSLFSTMDATKNVWQTVFLYFAQKCAGEEGKAPPQHLPLLTDNTFGTFRDKGISVLRVTMIRDNKTLPKRASFKL